MKRLNLLCLAICVITNIGCRAQDNKYASQNIYTNDVVTLVSELTHEKELAIYNIGINDLEALPDVLKTGVSDSIKFHIDRPTFLYVGAFNMIPLYVIPGDRIIAENDTMGEIHFTNVKYPKRSCELNFFFKLNKYLQSNKKKSIVWETKTEEKFLDSLKSVRNLSPEFLQEAKYCIIYRNLKYFYLQRLKSKTFSGDIKPFPQNDSCTNLLLYRNALYNYIMLLTKKYNSEKFDFTILNQIAKNNFTGATKKCALFMFLNQKMNTQLNQPEYITAYNKFLQSYPGDSLSNYLKKSYNEKIAIKNSFERDVYKELLVNKANKLIPFSDILQKNKGKVIVLDFWARYCGPCLAQFPYSKKVENEFTHNQVMFIYLSMDHDYDKWLQKIKDLKIADSNRSYLLYLPEKSGILKYFRIETIPRYVVIGKSGKIISRDAPTPSDPSLLELIKENL